tara:strand:+ start:16441 stop:17019 length:579 start_codon:yes stop_codon:yes gene_type:complete
MEFLCQNCKQKVKEEDRENHLMSCVNAIRPEEYANLIPCEICSNLVEADNYIEHVNNCYRPQVPNSFFDFLRNTPLLNINGNVNGNDNIIEITDDSINDILNILSNINPLPAEDSYSDLTNLSEEIGNVEIGLKDFKNTLIRKEIDNFKCPICYIDNNICMETSCKHQLCEECCKSWFVSNKKCPICNEELE